MGAALVSADEFRRIVELALKVTDGEHTFVALTDTAGGTTRFANNQIVQNVHTRRVSLAVTVAFGRRHGTASTSDVGYETVRDTVKQAARIARASPEDPEYLPPLPPQSYPVQQTAQEETAVAGPARRIAEAGEAIRLCEFARLQAAGIVSTSATAAGVAASTGLFAYEQRSEARFSVTAMGGDSSGWAAAVHRSVDQLEVAARTRVAIDKAVRSADPKELPPGRYTVILEPSAVAGLIGPMIWMLDAKSYHKETSPYTGKLGRRILDSRLTLANRADHPALLGCGFNSEGLPAKNLPWIERGVLARLRYDRFTALEHEAEPSPALDAPYVYGEEATGRSVDDLIRSTDRGILVTNFWYIRDVNRTDLTLTGMTRDGTFLIEGGWIAAGLVNFRWHESPLRAFNQVEAFTAPADAVTNEHWKMLVPALKIRDFNFSSVTRF